MLVGHERLCVFVWSADVQNFNLLVDLTLLWEPAMSGGTNAENKCDYVVETNLN